MLDAIIIIALVLIVGGIGFYLYRAKRRAEHCIGCPNSKACRGKCNGNCDIPPTKKEDK